MTKVLPVLFVCSCAMSVSTTLATAKMQASSEYVQVGQWSVQSYTLPKGDYDHYQWAGSDRMVCFDNSHGQTRICQLRLTTGSSWNRLLKLEARYARSRRDEVPVPDTLAFSPNGNWAVWHKSPSGLGIARQDGSKYRSVPTRCPNTAQAWDPNSSRVIWFEQNNPLEKFKLVGDYSVTARRHASRKSCPSGGLGESASDRGDVDLLGLTISRSGKAIYQECRSASEEASGEVVVSEYNLKLGSRPPTKRRLRIPVGGAAAADIAFSPLGNRIAWLIRTASREEIWFGNLQNADVQQVGYCGLGEHWSVISDVAWRPDGKAISFTCGGKLLVVSVVSQAPFATIARKR